MLGKIDMVQLCKESVREAHLEAYMSRLDLVADAEQSRHDTPNADPEMKDDHDLGSLVSNDKNFDRK